MCWNKEVSLNTFVFSFTVLLLIMYNNIFTQYKIFEFNNYWVYIFLFLIIVIQLIEYFIWENINNPFYNSLFTKVLLFVTFLQPIASIFIITNNKLSFALLKVYLFLSLLYYLFKFYFDKLTFSTITTDGHLSWITVKNNTIGNIYGIIWLFFFLFPLFYNKFYGGLLIALLTLSFSIYNYYQNDSITSMWCFIANIVMLYYAAYLLIYLPFYK